MEDGACCEDARRPADACCDREWVQEEAGRQTGLAPPDRPHEGEGATFGHLRSSDCEPAPPLLSPRRLVQRRRASLARVGNLDERVGAGQVHGYVEQVREDGQGGRAREQREERQEERRLVVDAAIVRGDVVVVEKETLLYCACARGWSACAIGPRARDCPSVLTSLEAGDGRRDLDAPP